MILSLFVFIAWVIICIFFLIPKGLSIIDNIIIFFCFTIIVINIFTILDMTLRLIQHNDNPEMFISLVVQRNIIIPLGLVIYANLITFLKTRSKKIVITATTLLVLHFIELLTVWTNIKIYTGWNGYMDIATLAALMIFSVFLTKWIKKIPLRRI